jgi:hypothetical protein
VSTDLKTTFFHGLDEYLKGFLRLYQAKDIGELKSLIQSLEDDVSICEFNLELEKWFQCHMPD